MGTKEQAEQVAEQMVRGGHIGRKSVPLITDQLRRKFDRQAQPDYCVICDSGLGHVAHDCKR